MKKNRVAIGPGAASLILIVVVLSMSVLGILALMSARGDARLSRRSVEVTQAVYALENQAERRFASLDGTIAGALAMGAAEETLPEVVARNLPQGIRMDGDGAFSWEETDGLRTLSCRAALAPAESGQRLVWTAHRLTAVTEDTWN